MLGMDNLLPDQANFKNIKAIWNFKVFIIMPTRKIVYLIELLTNF